MTFYMPECRDQNRFNGDLERNINISTIYGNYIMVLISISSYYVRLSTLIFSVFDLFSFMSYKQYNPSLCNTETVLHPTVVVIYDMIYSSGTNSIWMSAFEDTMQIWESVSDEDEDSRFQDLNDSLSG